MSNLSIRDTISGSVSIGEGSTKGIIKGSISIGEGSTKGIISGSVSIGKGEQGIQGDKGDKGEQGLSAYEIWLSQGNEGTEQDFLNSLKAVVDLSDYTTKTEFINLKDEIEEARGKNQFLVDRLDYIDSDIQTINFYIALF